MTELNNEDIRAIRHNLINAKSYQEFLKLEYDAAKQHNPRFSIRAFGKKLSLSPSYLTEIMGGKYKVSEESVIKMIKGLKLNSSEEIFFKNLIVLGTATDSALIENAKTAIEKYHLMKRMDQHPQRLNAEAWHQAVIYEALMSINPKLSAAEIAMELDLDPTVIEKVLSVYHRTNALKPGPDGWLLVQEGSRREAQILMSGLMKRISYLLQENKTEPSTDNWLVYTADPAIVDKIREIIIDCQRTITLLIQNYPPSKDAKKQIRCNILGDYSIASFETNQN